MASVAKNNKKQIQKTKNVLVQPCTVIWPAISDNDFSELCSKMEQVERQKIVIGCNAVIKLLQNGEAAACFIHDSFQPRMFAKFIIQMARRRNPAVLIGAVPSLPTSLKTTNMLMAIVHRKADQQTAPVASLLDWMKQLSLEKGYVTAKDLRGNPPATERMVKKKATNKRPSSQPMTQQAIAKLYVLEPAAGDAGAKQKREDYFKSADFISFSDQNKRVTIHSKPSDGPSNKPLIDRKVSSYVPLTVNKVRGNPDRVEQKMQKKKKNLTTK